MGAMDVLLFLVLLIVIGMFFIDHRLKRLVKLNQEILNELKSARATHEEPLPPPLRLTKQDIEA